MDLAIQFRIKNGPRAGELTRPFGGRWDKQAEEGDGGYIGWWDPDEKCWQGEKPENIRVINISEQSEEFITDFEYRMILALGGRRSGKTTGSMAPKIIIMLLIFAGLQGEVLSPTYRQSKNVWRAVMRFMPRSWVRTAHKTEHKITLINGASVVFLSADNPDSPRSEGVAWGAYDERQDISDEAAENAIASTSEGGDDFIIFETGTIKPELRDHYDKMMASDNCKIYRMRSRGNPFISHALFDFAAEMMDKARALQELEAEWPELVGRCYYPFVPERHIIEWPIQTLNDITTSYCHEHFDTPLFGDEAGHFIIGVDPPHHLVINKIYQGGIIHAIDEVVVGADGRGGDVRDLARMCRGRCGNRSAVVVFDPHETKWDHDVKKYFKQEDFRLTSMRRVEVEYRLTAFRARIEKNLFFVSPRCSHLIEALNLQTYVNGRPDKNHKSKITETTNLDHIVDAEGYAIYKMFPAKIDYEKNEKRAA